MARAGLVLNAIFILLLSLLGYALVIVALGVEPGTLPEWAR
jgi:hypothetical protein